MAQVAKALKKDLERLPMKDHEISEMVNRITKAVRDICPNAPQCLRQVISQSVRR